MPLPWVTLEIWLSHTTYESEIFSSGQARGNNDQELYTFVETYL